LQTKTIKYLRCGDVFAILPTGYGKSAIYQILPYFVSVHNNENFLSPKLIIIAPLNAILNEQIIKF